MFRRVIKPSQKAQTLCANYERMCFHHGDIQHHRSSYRERRALLSSMDESSYPASPPSRKSALSTEENLTINIVNSSGSSSRRSSVENGTAGSTSSASIVDNTASSGRAMKDMGALAQIGAQIKGYAELSKYKLSSLVVLTTGAGFACAGGPVDFPTMIAACVGTAFCASSASTINQVIEKERDAKMRRTMHRPMPSNLISVPSAKAFASLTGVAGTSLLFCTTTPLVSALGAINIALYGGLYTYSKQKTEFNTWIGALVGAIPPVMGWAAATNCNSLVTLVSTAEPISLGLLLFLWQFPHFFALAWMYREDYARGGFHMVSVQDPTGSRTAELIAEYSLYLTVFPLLASPAFFGVQSSYMFAVEATAANAYLLYQAKRFYGNRSNANARRVFLCSLWYLPVLLTAFVFHSRNWAVDEAIMEAATATAAAALTLQQQQQEPSAAASDGDMGEKEAGGKLVGEESLTACSAKAGNTAAQPDMVLMGVARTKEFLRGLCVHEIFANNEKVSNPTICAKIGGDKMKESAQQGVGVVVEAASVAARKPQLSPLTTSGSPPSKIVSSPRISSTSSHHNSCEHTQQDHSSLVNSIDQPSHGQQTSGAAGGKRVVKMHAPSVLEDDE